MRETKTPAATGTRPCVHTTSRASTATTPAGSTSTMSLRQYVTPRLIREDPALVVQILDLDFLFMAAVWQHKKERDQ
ncbi:hypothetical protein Pcinc_022932 [Petrolisthes cinctipes]|uniref:Uncharacterized protein n=1 Tax=Petrolisthes cinctipes TaxID=88211 RepID=A0AAE1FGT5_PETCI|nr:hypothetical protein Pcinc_022932 [Petrolisthes cinctipes]